MASNDKSSTSSQLRRELRLLGVRTKPWIPTKVLPGPFVFTGVITDNATTESDLKADANNVDPGIEQFAGSGANARVVLVIERLKFLIEKGTETAAVIADVLEQVYLRHVRVGGADRRLSLHPYARTVYEVPTVGEGAAATTRDAGVLGSGNWMDPIFGPPWVVDLQSDPTFAIGMRTQVDTAANVPFVLYVGGYAMRKDDVHAAGGFQAAQCGGSQAEAEAVVQDALETDLVAVAPGIRELGMPTRSSLRIPAGVKK